VGRVGGWWAAVVEREVRSWWVGTEGECGWWGRGVAVEE